MAASAPPIAMTSAASQMRLTSGRIWMRRLQRPAPRSSPSATRRLLPRSSGCGSRGHLALHPVLALLGVRTATGRAVARHHHVPPHGIVVRAFDRLHALEAEIIGADAALAPGASATSCSIGEGLHGGEGKHERPSPMCAMVMPSTARGRDSPRRQRSIGSTSEERMIQMPERDADRGQHLPPRKIPKPRRSAEHGGHEQGRQGARAALSRAARASSWRGCPPAAAPAAAASTA